MKEDKDITLAKQAGNIGNYYGGLNIAISDDKYYWGIENWDGTEWEEIPKYLFDAINRYEDERT